MRILLAVTLFVFACGGTKPKKESAIVSEGDDSPTCCCKTVPTTAEKELVPVFTVKGRMECSSSDRGDCVADVQCANSPQPAATEDKPAGNSDGVPPPPVIQPSKSSGGIP